MKNRKFRVVIVDNNLEWRKTLSLFFAALTDVDVEVVGMVPNGRYALAFCQQARPDLVVLNINLSDMDGVQTAQELIEWDPTLWIIGVTSDVKPASPQLVKESGIKAIIPKDMLLDYVPFKRFHRNMSA